MLHSVRFLQSQWNARSPELTLRDFVDLLRTGSSPALLQKARRHYRSSRIQCFLRSVAVAVDGPLPTTGALLIGSPSDPDFTVASIRPCVELGPAEVGLDPEIALQLRQQLMSALEAGLLVYMRCSEAHAVSVKRIQEEVRARRYPVLQVNIEASHSSSDGRPMTLAEVVVRLSPTGDTSESCRALH
jgi:hypothetical protein